jgi:glycosyltransferase involved in cell wall biosynthesis
MSKNTIVFLTYDWSFGVKPIQPNGCAWYRCSLPVKELSATKEYETGFGFPGFNEKHGFGVLIPNNKAVHGWDVVVLKLIMLKKITEQIPLAQAMGQKIVIDLDDHMEGLEKSNLAYHMTSPEKNENNNRDHYMKSIEQADALITSTPFLQEFYQKKHPNKPVYLVRNGIDIDRWTLKRGGGGNKPVFGWVGATPWRSGDLETLAPHFGDFIESKELKFHHSGSIKNAPTVQKQLGIPEHRFTHEPMKPINLYPELFRKIDVGIVPLRHVEFNEAKSFIKGLEYGASGVPFIAQDISEYNYLAETGVGRVARNIEEWLEHSEQLLDPKTRHRDKIKNIENIKKYHTMEQRRKDWDKVMKEISSL